MSATEHLKNYGVTPRLKEGGKIGLQGVGNLPDHLKAEVVTWARDNRAAILQELNPDVKNVFTEKGAPAPPAIEAMTVCLHGKQCPHLDAPGERRPLCGKADAPVFDLTACPLNKWARGVGRITKQGDENQKRKAEAMKQQDEGTPFIVTDSLEIHPIGEIMPWMTDAEMDGLKTSIQKHGLLDPIVLFQGKVIDGKCRYRACQETGATVWGRKWEGGMDPVEYVMSANLHRQHQERSINQ